MLPLVCGLVVSTMLGALTLVLVLVAHVCWMILIIKILHWIVDDCSDGLSLVCWTNRL